MNFGIGRRAALGAWLAAGLVAAAPAAATIKGQEVQSTAGSDSGTEFSWQLGFNPSFGNDLDVSDDRITNENAISGSVKLEHVLPSRTYFSGTLGAEANPEFAKSFGLPGAAAVAQLQIGRRWLVGSPAPEANKDELRDLLDLHGSYEFKHGFEDDDDPLTDNDYTDHQFGLELSFKNLLLIRKLEGETEWKEGVAVELTGGLARVESNQAGREKSVATATAELTIPLERFPDLSLKAGYERTHFDQRVGGLRRRDATPTLFLGLDVTDLLEIPSAEEIALGVEFSRNWSTIEAEDDSSVQVQLAFTFGGKRKLR